MNCSEMIVAEDVSDYIIEYNPRALDISTVGDEVCFLDVDASWRIGYTRPKNGQDINIADIGYQTVPKLYGLMDTTSFDESGISATLNQPFLDVAGQGVIVGIIDTGIDYNLDAFKLSPVESKIGTIWDQTSKDVNYSYGRVYSREEINEAIRAEVNNSDGEQGLLVTDRNGHGTMMAGIISQAAPKAELAVVKLKPAKQYLRDYFLIRDDAVAYQENDIMLGVKFLLDYANGRRLPLVICLGLGTGSGPRTGHTPLGSLLGYAAGLPNIVVVTCMGNEANGRMHVFGRIGEFNNSENVVEINVGSQEKGFVMELWSATQDVLSVSLTSPSGEVVPRIPARNNSSNLFRFLLETTEVTVDYRIVESSVGQQLIFLRFDRPAPGIWKVNVYSLTNIVGAYNVWMPLKDFVSSDTFLLGASPNTTLTEPAAVETVISVGAYDHTTGAAYIGSGRGYTALGQVKPELAAPGVNVYSSRVGGGNSYITGTSVAAAHVAGAAALLLTWGVYYGNLPQMGTGDVKYILIRGATRATSENYPNRINGYGNLNLIESFNQLRVT